MLRDEKNKNTKRRFKKVEQVSSEIGVEPELVLKFIHRSWITPVSSAWDLDEEDVARARLIFELQHDFGVNDEGIPILLHLLDQIYAIRALLKEHTS